MTRALLRRAMSAARDHARELEITLAGAGPNQILLRLAENVADRAQGSKTRPLAAHWQASYRVQGSR